MKLRLWPPVALVCGLGIVGGAPAQTAPPPAPAPAAVAAPGVPPARVSDASSITTLTLPADNPFGVNVEVPAAPPPKPAFNEFAVTVPLFGTMRVDRTG